MEHTRVSKSITAFSTMTLLPISLARSNIGTFCHRENTYITVLLRYPMSRYQQNAAQNVQLFKTKSVIQCTGIQFVFHVPHRASKRIIGFC